MVRGGLTVALAALAALAVGCGNGFSTTPTPLRPCAGSTKTLCATITVPLDPAGKVHGKVRLHVEAVPPLKQGSPGVVFLIAGGPGQGSADAFDLRHNASLFQSLFPRDTIVAYDDRGTGASDPIHCPGSNAIINANPADAKKIVDACARRLGPAARFYSTRDNAADMDAIRRVLGVDRISMYGVSYGTEQALVYALLDPSHVDRVVLDSMLPPGEDQFTLDTLDALPHAFGQICRASCARAIPHPAAELATLANRLTAHPRTIDGVRIDGERLFTLAIDTDLDNGLAATVPAAVHAGVSGNLHPLARLVHIDDALNGAAGVDAAVNIATVCDDGPMPWPRGAAKATRSRDLSRALAKVTARDLRSFGRWFLEASPAATCIDWPGAGDGSPPHAAHLPGVQTLILSGSRDLRTPTGGAERVARAIGSARVLVVPGSGHDVLEGSECPVEATAEWIAGLPSTAHTCPAISLGISVPAPLETPTGTGRLTAQQTAAVAAGTVEEAAALATAFQGSNGRSTGLAGGSLAAKGDSAALGGFADVAGVTVTGTVAGLNGQGSGWHATVSVAGGRAAAGTVTIAGGLLTGTLGGRKVSLHL